MPINSKWILTLGILAMSPTMAKGGPFGLPNPFKSPAKPETQAAPATSNNQEVANQIAAALTQARLTGYDINIEYQNGVATLSGMIQDAQQKQKATEVAQSVAAVSQVDNRMGLINAGSATPIQQVAHQAPTQRPVVDQAAFEAPQSAPTVSPIQQVAGTAPKAAPSGDDKARNQATANQIAYALRDSGVSGYDIEISYKNGVASLAGVVGTPEQREYVSSVVSRVPGVQNVDNQLQVNQPVMQTAAYQPALVPSEAPADGGQPGPGGYPGAGHPGPYGMVPPGPGGPAPIAPPPTMGHPGPGPVNPVYNQPYLPDHAWPTYAAYPNYGAVTYPKQYSASAFPYIGPFYPYPQVPMGWRSSTLEWDDGEWQLKFSPQTDRWWWFMNPKNWD